MATKRTNKSPAPVAVVRPARARVRAPAFDCRRALVGAFRTNERINQTLLGLVDASIWKTVPKCATRRSIAALFAHIHNVRCMRIKHCGGGIAPPARLNRATMTIAETRRALGQSAAAMLLVIDRAMVRGGQVPGSPLDVVAMVCAAITHEAHHRGQVCHWARVLHAPIGPECQMLLWDLHANGQDAAPAVRGGAR
jgi:uncharacterized damage-inducible protein DinB